MRRNRGCDACVVGEHETGTRGATWTCRVICGVRATWIDAGPPRDEGCELTFPDAEQRFVDLWN